MQILYGEVEIAGAREGSGVSVVSSRALDSYVPTGSATASIGTAPVQPAAASFMATKRCADLGSALVALFAPADLPFQGDLVLGAETMPDAVLASASSSMSGLAVTTQYQFQGGQVS